MKIRLPNPIDFLGKEEMFFEQLELSLYHAKKTWLKISKTYDKNIEYPWILFVHTEEIEEAMDKVDPDGKDRGNIDIEIVEP